MCCGKAQFGDFVNGAQSIIDEFISSGEASGSAVDGRCCCCRTATRARASPHHTSGRWTSNAPSWSRGPRGFDDDRGAVSVHPPDHFELLRRHGLDGVQRPLIVFTPKSMLRNKAAVSDIRDFTEQKFRSVLEEPTYTDGDGDRTKVRWVLLTSWQALLRAGRPQDQGHAMASRSCASSSSRRRPAAAGRDAGPVPQRRREFWVQEESATGVWPRFGLELPELLSGQLAGLKRISRRAIRRRRRARRRCTRSNGRKSSMRPSAVVLPSLVRLRRRDHGRPAATLTANCSVAPFANSRPGAENRVETTIAQRRSASDAVGRPRARHPGRHDGDRCRRRSERRHARPRRPMIALVRLAEPRASRRTDAGAACCAVHRIRSAADLLALDAASRTKSPRRRVGRRDLQPPDAARRPARGA